jgi:hypothetical protein
MTVTRAQLVANTLEFMDANGSPRWTTPVVQAMLGIAHAREWSGILGTNQYFRFAQRTVTTDVNGQVAYTALNSGTGDAAQAWRNILAITDGQVIYRQTAFTMDALATVTNQAYQQYDRQWYDAGNNIQFLPVSTGVILTITVNWTPTRVDLLSADSVVVDFPDGYDIIIALEAAALLLSKGAAENEAAQTMRAMADAQRQALYGDIARRGAAPTFMRFPDSASTWAG